jgi:hypothetical protein
MTLFAHREPAALSKVRCARWILAALAARSLAPLRTYHEPSLAGQLRNYVLALSAPRQSHFKESIALALARWRPDVHASNVLSELLGLVGDLGIDEAIPSVRDLVQRHKLSGLSEEARMEVTGVLIAVLSGFGPTIESRLALEHMFYSDDTDPRFAGQLFAALVRCNPTNLETYTSRYVRLRSTGGDAARHEAIAWSLVRSIPLDALLDRAADASGEVGAEMIAILLRGQGGPLEYTFDSSLSSESWREPRQMYREMIRRRNRPGDSGSEFTIASTGLCLLFARAIYLLESERWSGSRPEPHVSVESDVLTDFVSSVCASDEFSL